MKCGSCGFETDGKRFCTNCGAPLSDNKPGGGTDERERTPLGESEKGEAENSANAPNGSEHSENVPTAEGEEETQSGTESEDNFAKALNELLDEVRENEPAADDGDYSGQDGASEKENGEFDIEQTAQPESEAMFNLKQFEEGSITHPKDKPKEKRKFYCPKNPMLWAFLCLLGFGLILGGLTAFFFNVDLDGAQIVFGIAFSVFTAAVILIDFIYYFPAAWELDRLLKGKGVRLEYKLKKYETVELAERAKKRNRGFYLAIGLFGLAFSVYYIYILANAIVKTNLMWISLIFSLCVFVFFALLFFIMPKINYERMMINGEKVIIGNKSVYYGGVYYHWRKIQPDATFGNLNTKRHKLDIIFTQEFKNGTAKRRKVEIYAPDSAIRGISGLLREYEASVKKYQEKQERNSIVNELDSRDKSEKGKKKGSK